VTAVKFTVVTIPTFKATGLETLVQELPFAEYWIVYAVIVLPAGSVKITLLNVLADPKSTLSHCGLPGDGLPLACHRVLRFPSIALLGTLAPLDDEAEGPDGDLGHSGLLLSA